jgi:rhodanese-related sulfurtransferase
MSGYAQISPAEAHARLDEFHPVDVRGAHEYHGPLGRIRGSTLLPLPELAARARELPAGRTLLLVCRSGARSGKACEQLAGLGIGPVVNLEGGMIAWDRANLPVERTQPASFEELIENAIAWVAQVTARERGAVRAELAPEPTRDGVERFLLRIEADLRRASPPPDLELSLAAFRRALARI